MFADSMYQGDPPLRDETTRTGGIPFGIATTPLWWSVALYVGFLAVLLGFATTASYSRHEQVGGEIVPTGGLLSAAARRDGVISKIYVKGGDRVSQGDPLVALSVDTSLGNGQQLGELLVEAADAKARALDSQRKADIAGQASSAADLAIRREALDRQIALLGRSRAVAAERVRLAQERVARAKPLLDKGYVSGLQVQQWQDSLNSNQLGEIELEQRLSDALKERDRLATEARQQHAQQMGQQSAVVSAEADLLSTRASAMGQRDLLLRAEKPGRIAALGARIGMPVKAGETLATILPAGSRLQAQIWVPSQSIGFIRPGDTVELMFDSFPYQTFGMGHGKVREVANAPTLPDSAAGQGAQPRYEVLVDLDAQSVRAYGRDWSLIPGMKVQAVIILERRTVFQWLFDSLLGVRGNDRT